MRSEARAGFYHGFDLTEKELRRIYDCLLQQMSRVCQDSSPESSFKVRFRNGIIAEPVSLEEILGLENVGSATIVRFQIGVQDRVEQPNHSITLTFQNIGMSTENGLPAILYTIVGDDRDWVFLTSSQVEERISRIRHFTPMRWFGGMTNADSIAIIFLLMLLGGMGLMLPFAIPQLTGADYKTLMLKEIDALEAKYNSGEINDPLQVLLHMERARAELRNPPIQEELNDLVLAIGIALFVLVLGGFVWFRVFPPYNFIWGDCIRSYEKRKAARRFILLGVVLAIAISVFANYLSVILGIGK